MSAFKRLWPARSPRIVMQHAAWCSILSRINLTNSRELHMAQGMNWLAACLLIIFFILPFPAQAVICKTIDENGVVSYTDTPSTECANPVKLRGYSSYSPRRVDSSSDRATAAGDDETGEETAGYRSLRMVQPANNSTVRSNEGKVPVQIGLEPGLQQGHRIQILLDGQPVGSPLGATDAVLSGIERGTHQLGAEVLDGDANVVGTVGSVSFTLHSEALGSEESDDDTGSDDTDPYRPNFNPSENGGSFAPGFAPNGSYTPQPGGFPRSPGTNPAFSPNYNP